VCWPPPCILILANSPFTHFSLAPWAGGNQYNIIKINIGLFTLLGLLFVALKLTGQIAWPWLWVLAPFWAPLAIAIAIVTIVCSVAIILLFFGPSSSSAFSREHLPPARLWLIGHGEQQALSLHPPRVSIFP
jgi:hypothetical protein